MGSDRGPSRADPGRFTARQLEVLAALSDPVGQGTTKDAAHRLGISRKTANEHLYRVRRLLGVETTVQAVRLLAAVLDR